MNTRLEQLLSMLKNSPKDSFLTFAVAKEYENTGNLQTALEYFLKLKTNDPEYTGTYYHLAKLYEQLEDFEKALVTYEEGKAICKKVGDNHAWNELEREREALEE